MKCLVDGAKISNEGDEFYFIFLSLNFDLTDYNVDFDNVKGFI